MFKKHIIFSNTVHYCSSSMPRLSQTLRFLQSPSFRQAQSALIGQLTQCIVIEPNTTSTRRKCNVPFHNRELQLSVSFTISSSPKGEQSRVTDTAMMLVCICSTQATVKTTLTGCTLRCDVTLFPSHQHTHTHTDTHTQRVTGKTLIADRWFRSARLS